MAETLLHTGLTCGHRPPNLKTPSWDLEQHDFLINILSSMLSRSDVGALWCFFPAPSMLVWKGLGTLVTVLYFGFLFVVVFIDFHSFPGRPLPVSRAWERLQTVRSGRLSGGSFPLCRCARSVT